MTIKDIIDAVSGTGGVISLLVLILVSGLTGKWVFGWIYLRTYAEMREWRSLALSLLPAGHKAIELLEEEKE